MLFQLQDIQKVLFDFGHLCLLKDTKDMLLTDDILKYKDIYISISDCVCSIEVDCFINRLLDDSKILLYVFIPR